MQLWSIRPRNEKVNKSRMSSFQTNDLVAREDLPAPDALREAGTTNEPGDLRHELLPIAVCATLGLAMAILPPIIQWLTNGRMIWIGNGDELFMLALGSQAYHNHPLSLSDPVLASGGASLFRQLPLLPGVWTARLCDLGLGGMDNCWRVIGGVSLGAAWYLLIRQIIPGRKVAVALSSILLTDLGLLGSGLLFRQCQAFLRMLRGSSQLIEGPFLHSEWRMATPLLTLSYLVLNLWLTIRARQRPSTSRLVFAGLSLGLLFHVYPYYWTAACAALALAFAVDRGNRRVYFWTGILGILLGAPRIVWDFLLKQETGTEWLIRTDKLVRFSRLTDLKLPVVGSLVLLISGYWIWTRRRDLIYLWSMGVSGLVLFKSHILTGWSIENYHWYYVWGPCCSLLLLLLLIAVLPRQGRGAKFAIGLLLAASVADAVMGLWLRGIESVRAEEGLYQVRGWNNYHTQRMQAGVPPLDARSTVAGDSLFVDMASILENQKPLENYWVFLSPHISDADWYQRIALNAILMGQDRRAFESWSKERFAVRPPDKPSWGPWTRDAEDSARRIHAVMDAYDAVSKNFENTLELYDVRYVGLKSGSRLPAYLSGAGWTLIQEGPTWRIWKRSPRIAGRSTADNRTMPAVGLTVSHTRG
jgi:hypothetical protein